jgi:hypothetical protein
LAAGVAVPGAAGVDWAPGATAWAVVAEGGLEVAQPAISAAVQAAARVLMRRPWASRVWVFMGSSSKGDASRAGGPQQAEGR